TGALASFQARLEIAQRLAVQDGGNTGWQRDLSVSHDRIGDVQRAQGDVTGALASYQAGLEIAERLAAQDGGNAGWQAGLAVSHGRLGQVQLAKGEPRQALDLFRRGRDIVAPLAEASGHVEWQGYLDSFDADIARAEAALAE
ncbi:MAG: tetratricopeptide repeat protein, partial [Pseudomonadota bacterium]